MASEMASYPLFLSLFFILIFNFLTVKGRSYNGNDLSDIFYSEIRELLNQQQQERENIPVHPREVQG